MSHSLLPECSIKANKMFQITAPFVLYCSLNFHVFPYLRVSPPNLCYKGYANNSPLLVPTKKWHIHVGPQSIIQNAWELGFSRKETF